jgi:hypothetical protein
MNLRNAYTSLVVQQIWSQVLVAEVTGDESHGQLVARHGGSRAYLI